MSSKKAIVIGAGIVGLAAARSLALRGYKVSVFEKSGQATGASIRNFGMVWPIGQPLGHMYERAIRSRNVWKEICEEANIWYAHKGAIHVAYSKEEMAVIEEFIENNRTERDCTLLTAEQAVKKSFAINQVNLKGGFFSGDELIVNAREAIAAIPPYFKEKYNIDFHFNTAVTGVAFPHIYCNEKAYTADRILICSGPEFETLYPELYLANGLTRCKLQMMRTVSQGKDFTIGPALCGGLTLLHYDAFRDCASIRQLKAYLWARYPEYEKYGIHVMISQNGYNEVVIGDSHEYGNTPDPFNRKEINDLILAYLKQFVVLSDWSIDQSWIGVYAKMKGATELILQPEPGVTIVNGLGGAGMTLSFGLLEEILKAD